MEKAQSQYNNAKNSHEIALKDFQEAAVEAVQAKRAEEKAYSRAALLEAVADHTEEIMNSKLKVVEKLKK